MGQTTKTWNGLPVGRPIRPTVDDVLAVAGRVPGLAAALPELVSWGTTLTYDAKTVNTRVNGEMPGYGEIRNHIPRRGGRFINDADVAERRRVAFLGNAVSDDVFGKEADPVGRTILLNKVPYTVIGVMQKKLQMGTYQGPDEDHVVVPITTFKAQWGYDRVNTIILKPESPELMQPVLKGFRAAMARRFAFDPEDERVFPTWDTVKSSAVFGNIVLGINVFLAIIGSLTLLVGGVGVANIMYAVVNERTREIGVKMALGARRSWITAPLVLEGLIFTLVGGLIGLVLGVGVVALLGMVPTEGNEALEFLGHPVISLRIGLGSALILGLIGLCAGYFPARRAAAINPAETLRYE
jgi:putative ABC transport system permease protein